MENQNNSAKPNLYPNGGEITFIMPSTNAIGKLKDAEKGRNLSVKYKTKEMWINNAGVVERYYYLGLKSATNDKGDPYFLAKLSDGENTFVCAQTILIQSLMSVPFCQGVEVMCTGSTKTNGNNIPTFDVVDLGINLFEGNDE